MAGSWPGATPQRMLPQIFRPDSPVLALDLAPSTSARSSACSPTCARDLPRQRQPRLGLSVLADQAEGPSQRLRGQDRRPRAARRHPALHRALHGRLPARQQPRRLVGRAPAERSLVCRWSTIALHRPKPRRRCAATPQSPGVPLEYLPLCKGRRARPGIDTEEQRLERQRFEVRTRLSWHPHWGRPRRHLRRLADAARRAEAARPLLRLRALPGRRAADAGADPDGAGRARRPRRRRCRAARQPARAGAGPALRRDRRLRLALTAWRWPGGGRLPSAAGAELACSGLGIHASKADWLQLAEGDVDLQHALERIYDAVPGRADARQPDRSQERSRRAGSAARLGRVAPCWSSGRWRPRTRQRPKSCRGRGGSGRARNLAGRSRCVVTNVPYLARGKQQERCGRLERHRFEERPRDGPERCLGLCVEGDRQCRLPQNWLFLTSYGSSREAAEAGALASDWPASIPSSGGCGNAQPEPWQCGW